MRGVKKNSLGIKTETVIRKYDSFELAGRLEKNGVFPIEIANNCDLSDGNARVGVGASVYTLLEGESVPYDWNLSTPKCFFYNAEALGVISDENKLYYYDENTKKYCLEHTFYGGMKFFEVQNCFGEDQMCFCGEQGICTYDENAEMTQVFDSFCITTACVFQGRVFTASSEVLLYTAPFSLDGFNEGIDGGGEILLSSDTGEIVDIAATSDTVFVFCQYGIWKLTVAGNARDFRLERVGFTGRGILKGSACAVAFSGGEKVFFFDEYGPWKLDRLGVMRICSDLDFSLLKTGQVFEHAYLDGKVVYNYRDINDTVKSVVIDAETDKAYHSFTAYGLSNVRGQAVGVVDGFVQALKTKEDLPTNRLSELVAPQFDFNLSGVKTLRRLKLFGEGTITLSVSNGRKTKTFTLQTENGVASVDVRLKGEFFRLRFLLGRQAVIRGLEAELCKLADV